MVQPLTKMVHAVTTRSQNFVIRFIARRNPLVIILGLLSDEDFSFEKRAEDDVTAKDCFSTPPPPTTTGTENPDGTLTVGHILGDKEWVLVGEVKASTPLPNAINAKKTENFMIN